MREVNQVEVFVSQSLRFGVLLSAGVILVGLIKFLTFGDSGYPGETYPTHIKDIIMGAWQLKSFAIILAGLVLLILTPISRVGISILVFAKEKDWLYVGITTLVFFVLVCSFVFGK